MVLSVTDHPDPATATASVTSTQPAGAVTLPGVGQQAYAEADGTNGGAQERIRPDRRQHHSGLLDRGLLSGLDILR
jgi:hypothetical protein